MSRRDTAVHYLLEHRLALLVAGFVVLLDQLAADWALQRHASTTSEVATLPGGVPVALVVAAALALVGGLGLWWRVARTRRLQGGPCGAASELVVLAGALAIGLDLALRGSVTLPLPLQPLDWSVGPGLAAALPATAWLGVQTTRRSRAATDRARAATDRARAATDRARAATETARPAADRARPGPAWDEVKPDETK